MLTQRPIALIKKVKPDAQRNKTPIDVEFMEFTPKNHMKVRNEIKERCNKLLASNFYWWTKVVPGEHGNPNYRPSWVACQYAVSDNSISEANHQYYYSVIQNNGE